jgi:hypothetical protein
MKKICFFSSDARPLYKKDVFRAISYPKDYIIHFRYQAQHVNRDLSQLNGKAGIIFFSMGNDLSIEESKRNIHNASIREVTVHSVESADDTGLIHFYLKLGEFKIVALATNPPDIMPPNKFVTELEILEAPVAKWHQIIDLVKPSFPNQLFYKFQLMQKNGTKPLIPLYNEIEKQSFYKLSDETSYALEMAFYDTEPSNSNNYHGLRVTPMNETLVKVVAPSSIDLEARRDNRVYSMFTQTLGSSNSFTYINFETLVKSAVPTDSVTVTPTIDTTLKIEVEKNLNRTFAFALYSILAAFALGYGKILSDKVDLDGLFDWGLTLEFIFCALLGFFAAFKLYRLFDKK